MREAVITGFERAGRLLARLAPSGVCDPNEVSSTIREVCEGAYAKGGWPAFIAAGVLECADVSRSMLGARLGEKRLSIVTGQTSPPGTPSPHRGRIMIDDLLHAFRRLRGRPGTFMGAAAMLALAIGVTTAMFTIMDALVLRTVPFHDPDRLVRVVVTQDNKYMQYVGRDLVRTWRSSPAFEALHGMVQEPATIEGGVEPVTRGGARITPGMIEMLGVKPLFGRTFVAGEGRTGTDDRVILSEDLWRSQFAADRGIIGRRIELSGKSVEVIGIMPASFHFPFWNVSIWRPVDLDAPPQGMQRLNSMWAYARVSSALPSDVAAQATADVMHRSDSATATQGVRFDSMRKNSLDSYSRLALTALAVGVGLVFLALCANVTSLILARMTARRRELAVCAALGAGRGRLLRQALAENVALGLTGSIGGLGVAVLLVTLARHYMPEGLLIGTLKTIEIDVRAVAATSIAGLIATLLAGVVPAWLSTRVDTTGSMHLKERGTTDSVGERRFSRGLLVGEMALAVALLVGAGVLLRSFVNLSRADRGLDATDVITGWVELPAYAFADRPTRYAYADALDTALRQVPGVADLSLSYGMPPGSAEIDFGDVRSDLPGALPQKVVMNASDVQNSFFRVYRIRLLDGRLFEPTDSSSDVVIGEQLATMLWPGTSAVGHSFTLNNQDPARVVGVVNEIRSPSNDPREDYPEVYRPLLTRTDGQVVARAFGSGEIFGLRCAARCPGVDVVREHIRSINPHALIAHLGPLDDDFITALARPRAAAALALAFAVIATIVTAGGIFSVLSYAVWRRIREFGIRAAMGAHPADLRRLVLIDALRIGLAGLTLGAVAAWALSRSLTALAYGVTGADPLTWGVVLVVLAGTTMAASWRPARQAMRADPVKLLRED